MQNENIISQVIKSVGDQGGTGNLMEALNLSQSDFQNGFELANKLQNMDLVKLLYSNYNQNKIIIEFTLLGKAKYESI
jgi:hypothetical protein